MASRQRAWVGERRDLTTGFGEGSASSAALRTASAPLCHAPMLATASYIISQAAQEPKYPAPALASSSPLGSLLSPLRPSRNTTNEERGPHPFPFRWMAWWLWRRTWLLDGFEGGSRRGEANEEGCVEDFSKREGGFERARAGNHQANMRGFKEA
jgi:hypothetical protein